MQKVPLEVLITGAEVCIRYPDGAIKRGRVVEGSSDRDNVVLEMLKGKGRYAFPVVDLYLSTDGRWKWGTQA